MNKKRGLGLLVVLSFLAAVVFVTAQEDPQLAPFDATVNVQNAPPTIVAFLPVMEEPDNAATPLGQVQPIGGATVDARVRFIVEDPNGPDDLPGLTGPPIVVGSNVGADLRAPANGASGQLRSASACSAVECASGTNPDCLPGAFGTNHLLQKEYVCDITMEYYDEPTTDPNVAGDTWTIETLVQDAGGSSDTKTSDDFTPFDRLNYMEYLEILMISAAGSISWGSLDINAEDTPADGSDLLLQNLGNVQINDVDVTGQDLTGVNDVNAIMSVAAFSSSSGTGGGPPPVECDGPSGGGAGTGAFELADLTPVTVTGVDLPFGPPGAGQESNLYFCIWAAVNPAYLSGPFDTGYSATQVKGNEWDVEYVQP